jgi:hypothetical protein
MAGTLGHTNAVSHINSGQLLSLTSSKMSYLWAYPKIFSFRGRKTIQYFGKFQSKPCLDRYSGSQNEALWVTDGRHSGSRKIVIHSFFFLWQVLWVTLSSNIGYSGTRFLNQSGTLGHAITKNRVLWVTVCLKKSHTGTLGHG